MLVPADTCVQNPFLHSFPLWSNVCGSWYGSP